MFNLIISCYDSTDLLQVPNTYNLEILQRFISVFTMFLLAKQKGKLKQFKKGKEIKTKSDERYR